MGPWRHQPKHVRTATGPSRALNDWLHGSDEMAHVGADEDERVHTVDSLKWDAS